MKVDYCSLSPDNIGGVYIDKMDMPKFSELTAKQIATICNGCGGKGSWIKAPNFLFKASCYQHDYRYWLGTTKADRKRADEAFYRWMKRDIKERGKWYNKAWYHTWAYTYYKAVRIGGSKYFNKNKVRTLKDLNG